jgi:hypothetical protein
MTSTLKWRPVVKYSGSLPDELKYVLRKRNDGERLHDVEYGEEDLEYLVGLYHANIDGADKLYKTIKKHGRIILTETY